MFEELKNKIKQEQEYLKKKYDCPCENKCGRYLDPNTNWLYCDLCLDAHSHDLFTKHDGYSI